MNSKQNTPDKRRTQDTCKEPNHTPGQAEGDEKTVEKALKNQSAKSK